MKKYLVLLFAFILCSCSPANPYEKMEKEEAATNAKVYAIMGWVLTANPKADAFNAFSGKDYKFYALHLHHRTSIPVYEDFCPGWRMSDSKDKIISTAIKYLDGSGYGAESYEHRKLDAIARLYIEDYNWTLWFHLTENNYFKCIS